MTMLRVRTILTGVAGTPWYSNQYFDADEDPIPTQPVLDAVGDMWTALEGAMSNNVNWSVEPEVALIDEADGDLIGAITANGHAGVGEATDDELPFATQGLVRLNTTSFVHSRRVRGRIFIPALGESNNNGGVPSGVVQAAMVSAVVNLLSVAAAPLVVWSRPFAGTEGNPARVGSKHAVTSAVAATQWAVLRSRRD